MAIALALGSLSCAGEETPQRDPVVDRDSDTVALPPGPAPTAPPIAPADTGAWVVEVPDGSTPDPSGWTIGATSGGSAGGIAVLQTIRTGRQDGYDRVVFEFRTRVPGWRAEYVDTPQYECGSGEMVRVAGDAWLQVSFEPANAHTEEGRPTAQRQLVDPAGENLRELRRICDFEAHVDYVIGVGSPNRYRAFTLAEPARLVIDIRHR